MVRRYENERKSCGKIINEWMNERMRRSKWYQGRPSLDPYTYTLVASKSPIPAAWATISSHCWTYTRTVAIFYWFYDVINLIAVSLLLLQALPCSFNRNTSLNLSTPSSSSSSSSSSSFYLSLSPSLLLSRISSDISILKTNLTCIARAAMGSCILLSFFLNLFQFVKYWLYDVSLLLELSSRFQGIISSNFSITPRAYLIPMLKEKKICFFCHE